MRQYQQIWETLRDSRKPVVVQNVPPQLVPRYIHAIRKEKTTFDVAWREHPDYRYLHVHHTYDAATFELTFFFKIKHAGELVAGKMRQLL